MCVPVRTCIKIFISLRVEVFVLGTEREEDHHRSIRVKYAIHKRGLLSDYINMMQRGLEC